MRQSGILAFVLLVCFTPPWSLADPQKPLSGRPPNPSGARPDPTATARVRVSEVTLHHDMDCYKVETPSATYVYGKKGAGFASILDKDGRDWISYRPRDKAKGEYRGLPKCGQPTKYFHCGYGYGMYKTANGFTTRVSVRAADHVRIESETADKKTACTWDFYPTHATMTLLRIDQPTYWYLYEGTPGGKLDADKDFVIRPDGTKSTLDQPWSQVVPWVCFGAAETSVGFFCINHQEPEEGETDSYVSWPFQKGADRSFQDMTVFGFGRKGYKELVEHVPDLKRLPARFSIGFVATADHKTAKTACEAIRQRLREEKRGAEPRTGKKKTCTIELDTDPAEVKRARLQVLIWDGGAGAVKDYFTLNGHPLSVARVGKHDVIYSRLDLDPKLLHKGANQVEVLSDTEHHGLEVLMPGPALVVRVEH